MVWFSGASSAAEQWSQVLARLILDMNNYCCNTNIVGQHRNQRLELLVAIGGWCIDIDGKSGGELLETQPVAVVMSVGGWGEVERGRGLDEAGYHGLFTLLGKSIARNRGDRATPTILQCLYSDIREKYLEFCLCSWGVMRDALLRKKCKIDFIQRCEPFKFSKLRLKASKGSQREKTCLQVW